MNNLQELTDDAYWMRQALAAAQEAGARGEVPVGAVVVRQGQLIATGSNAPIAGHDPTAHAEIAALRAAALKLGNYRLDDCELYVTLEPCAMCAGAMLHARLKRVVFGAPDPRTGAAGSVLNLFAEPQLNHQTQLAGGVLAPECGAMLREFFRPKRSNPSPLREDALRTPDTAFAALPGYSWHPHYVSNLPSLAGLRMHYVDEGEKSAPRTWLCLHGNPSWSYLYRHMIAVFAAAGDRVVAPDMPGFGKSDKPKRESAHNFVWHRQVLLELIERLDLKNIILVVQDWGGLLGLTLPMAAPDRYKGLLVMNTMLGTANAPLSPGVMEWRRMCANKPAFDIGRLLARSTPQLSAQERKAYEAPFPDSGYRAATRAFPAMVPESVDEEAAVISRVARQYWSHQWTGQSLMVVGGQDPVIGIAEMQALRADIQGCPAPWVIEHAGHFVPELGKPIAERALDYFEKN
ncbi:tRNA adenosine(34) deaminase TadA [Ottowia thiooxydans]|uniref:tRNA adenosine(34) deaminase TadA n=1 Tax=Ottowia thiooxydans TaxID=219182 RepID=UPI000408AF54|nr:tRNA adenosine(34) deaminase TadA [Ottowia thiooxydans]